MKRIIVGVIGFLFIFGMAVWANAGELEDKSTLLQAQLQTSQMEIKYIQERYSNLLSLIKRQQQGLRDIQTAQRKAAADKVAKEKEVAEAKVEPPKKEPKKTE